DLVGVAANEEERLVPSPQSAFGYRAEHPAVEAPAAVSAHHHQVVVLAGLGNGLGWIAVLDQHRAGADATATGLLLSPLEDVGRACLEVLVELSGVRQGLRRGVTRRERVLEDVHEGDLRAHRTGELESM